LSERPPRSYLVGFTAATVVLIIVSVAAGAYYYTANSELQSKDREILSLRASLLVENATALELELKIIELDTNMSALTQEITALTQSEGASSSQISSLTLQLLSLKNQSAFASLELSAAEHIGNLSFVPFFVNDTVSVPPGSSMEIASESSGYNGTLAFISPAGCPSPGENLKSTTPQYVEYLLLSPGALPSKSQYARIDGQPFSFYLQNVGQSAVQCTFSLLFVRQ
jgi:hypothetical protein